MEGEISWFLWRCGGKLRVPLELHGDLGVPSRVSSGRSDLLLSCEGHLGIPLVSLQA